MSTQFIAKCLLYLLYVVTASMSNKCDKKPVYDVFGQNTFISYSCDVMSFPLRTYDIPCHQYLCTLTIRSTNTVNISNEILFKEIYEVRITELYMNNLHISDLGPKTFLHFNKLQKIVLSSNDLVIINVGTFSALQSLQYIDLSKNKLKSLSRYSFTGTLKLNFLNLSKNFLTTFDVLSISSSNQMNLDLSFNNITDFQFEHATGKIEKLNLSHNLLTEIKDCFPAFNVTNLNSNKLNYITNRTCFSGIEDSTYMNLGSNQVSELHSGFFEQMSNLQYLYLDNNNLKSLPTDIFSKLHSLQILNISHNHLRDFQYGLFDHLENLKMLDVSHNELSNIENNLHSLTKLKDLRIDHNKIDVMDTQGILRDFPALKNISLDGNRFSCKDLVDTFRSLRARNITVPFGETKTVDNIHGITCYGDKSVRKGEIGSDIMKTVEKLVMEKLSEYEKGLKINNKSLPELFSKGFRSSDFHNYLEKLVINGTYHFNESEFVNYFDRDFKNSTFFKYMEKLKETEMAAADINKKFYDYFNKDFINSTFVKYFENIKNTDDVFNDSFIKSKMFNFFNKDFQNSSFYKYLENLRLDAGINQSHNTKSDFSNPEKLTYRKDSERNESPINVMIVLSAIQILIVSFLSCVVFKIYATFVRHGSITHEQVELIDT